MFPTGILKKDLLFGYLLSKLPLDNNPDFQLNTY